MQHHGLSSTVCAPCFDEEAYLQCFPMSLFVRAQTTQAPLCKVHQIEEIGKTLSW